MSIKGINKKAHINLIASLDQLELLLRQFTGMATDTQEIDLFKTELHKIVGRYEALLAQLTEEVSQYNQLTRQIKVRFINQRLRMLKKILPEEREDFLLLKKCLSRTNM